MVATVLIHTAQRQVTNRQRWPASFTLINTNSMVQSRGQMRVRGSSSAKREKKPYRIELQDDNGEDLKTPLLGMPKESDWILYPAYTDKTMIRDVLAYELWRQMGYWAPRTRYVHLFIFTNSPSPSFISNSVPSVSSVLNPSSLPSFPSVKENSASDLASIRDFRGDTPGYQGLYILMEKIKRGKNRVNIQKLPRSFSATSVSFCSNDVSGGYIFKKDRHNSTNETHIHTSKNVGLIIEEPKARDLTSEQESYFTNYINEFEAVLFSDYFDNPVAGYKRYVDIDSFVDYHWMQELSKNADAYWVSEFYSKDRGGKIKIGPLWDFDLCFGNTWYNGGQTTNDWRWQKSGGDHYTWYKRMFQDDDFLQRYIDRWSELRANVLSTSNVLGLIDHFAAEIAEAQKLNYERWPTLGKKIGPVYFVGQTWEEEVQWLKDWMIGRLAWIDSQDFPKPVLEVISPSDALSRELASFAGNSPPPLLSVSLTSFPSVNASASSVPSVVSLASVSDPIVNRKSPIVNSSELAMSCEVGSIFYTTNNTDPRLPGGHVATNALLYTSPIPITPGVQIKARVLSDYGLWSAPALYP